jgi:hypothetical protein
MRNAIATRNLSFRIPIIWPLVRPSLFHTNPLIHDVRFISFLKRVRYKRIIIIQCFNNRISSIQRICGNKVLAPAVSCCYSLLNAHSLIILIICLHRLIPYNDQITVFKRKYLGPVAEAFCSLSSPGFNFFISTQLPLQFNFGR